MQTDLYVSEDAAGFARAMAEGGSSIDDLVYFLEKPWKWQSEFEQWAAAGRPDAFVPDGDE